MSPSKESDVTKGVINCPNPSTPLRINRESHVSTKHFGASAKRQPVIIYTHAPKVIHAQARDFMAIVQKLTGMSRTDAEDTAVKLEVSIKDEDLSDDQKDVTNNNSSNNIRFPETEIMSDLIDDCRMKHHESSSSMISPMYKVSNTYLVDAPLFTPNSNEYFCSSRSNPFFQPSNMAASISPSFMNYTRTFSDY